MQGGWNKGLVQTDWSRQIKEKYGEQFELIFMSETNDKGERTLVIRCSTCGTEKTISSISTRGSRKRRCTVCFPPDRTNIIRSHARSENTKRIKSLETRLKNEKKRNKKKLEKNQLCIKFCEDCNLVIIPNNRKVCDECKRKSERSRETKKWNIRRLKTREDYDSEVTLDWTIEQYNNICYLCGKPCDRNDYKIVNGNKVVGRSYPTMEHVIPICEGGKHTKDNVKLACHACNSKKGRKLLAG